MEKVPKNEGVFVCELCDFKCFKLSNWSKHISTRKHLGKSSGAEKIPKFKCETCNVICYKKSNWNKHILTSKHLYNNKNAEKNAASHSLVINEISEIKNEYSQESHNVEKINENLLTLICEQMKTMEKITNQNTELQKQNTELVNKAIELCKPVNNNTTINNNNNNQRFNINVFLNEQCKDAINFSDFVKNIQISYEDLENNAQLGFVNGISKIFMDNLKQLDVNERPIHCTDVKRETMYIKDDNTWTKQGDDEKLQKAIQTVSYRSMGKLAEWKNENPDYKDCNSEFSQKCLDIQRQTLAGSERGVYYPKVIHALARETIIDK